MNRIDWLSELAPRLIDLSADFRLRDAADYERWYGHAHAVPNWLPRFTYGLPELHRDALRKASHVSGVGCNATATILALYPLFKAGIVDLSRDVIVEVKVGSSEGGHRESPASHHPERSHSVRSYAPIGHRHTAEVMQELSVENEAPSIHLSVTAVELVRGVLATGHVFLRESLTEQKLWTLYRATYAEEPFVRLVHQRHGIHRVPEPKILAGSNYCDVGFALDAGSGRVVTLAALDNLVKGAAGSAVQSMNVMFGFEETAGLRFPGLHPI